MIARLLTELGGRVAHADVVATIDDTLTAERDPDGATAVEATESALVQVRLADQGRVGWAGGMASEADRIVAAARRSLEVSDLVPLLPPARSELPGVVTHARGVAMMGPADLVELTRTLADRIERPGRRLEVWAERSVGTVSIGNTRGVSAEFDVSLVGLGATVRPDQGPPAAFRVHLAQTEPFDQVAVGALADEVNEALAPPGLEFQSLSARVRVWFGPRAVRELILPLLSRQMGEGWLLRREPVPRYDERLTIVDDSLTPARPGSRPIDDDGVPTRRLTLIDRGQPTAGIVDVLLGSRHLRPPTGHGYRRGYAAPRVGFSNLLLETGTAERPALAAATGEGLYVPTLTFGPAPNPETGVFRVAVPWAYRMAGGEIVGRLDGLWLAGNVFELVRRVVAVGADSTWIGPVRVPSLVLDGVAATAR
jgi:PmbA protein